MTSAMDLFSRRIEEAQTVDECNTVKTELYLLMARVDIRSKQVAKTQKKKAGKKRKVTPCAGCESKIPEDEEMYCTGCEIVFCEDCIMSCGTCCDVHLCEKCNEDKDKDAEKITWCTNCENHHFCKGCASEDTCQQCDRAVCEDCELKQLGPFFYCEDCFDYVNGGW